MNNKKPLAKKGMAVVLTAALLAPTSAFAASPSDFSDFPSDWSAQALSNAVDNGLLGGYDGKINAKGKLTRAQMATIINRAFGSTAKASLNGYTDVSSNSWYADDMAKALQMGTFVGVGDGKLNPDANITRQEALAVLARAFAIEDVDASALDKFSDGDDVANWAKKTVAAMVQAGYINGYEDGTLNPKGTITRAEFAAIMDNMVKTYVNNAKEKSTTAEGNVLVRAGADLSGMTIKGDLILADGVGTDDVNLDGVTVEGRILIRGGDSDSIKLTNVKAKSVVVNNPNRAAGIVVKDSDLGTVTVNTDAVINGDVDNVVIAKTADVEVKGGTVKTVTVNAEGATVKGAGKVTTVKANANKTNVSVAGAKVEVSKDANDVTVGDTTLTPGQNATVNDKGDGITGSTGGNSGGGIIGGGGSTGGGSTGGGGSTEGGNTGGETTKPTDPSNPGDNDSQTEAAIVNAEESKIVYSDAGSYLALVFNDGFSSKNVKVTVGGTNVTTAVSDVMDDGSIAKLPLTAEPKEVTLIADKKTQTLNLGGKAGADAVYTGADYLPDYFMANGPLALWDYYLSNYDNAGNLRVNTEQTTFASGEAVNEHPFYSPNAEIDTEGKGTVDIMFNYTSAEDKAWFDAIAKEGALELVQYDQGKYTINDHLTYEKANEEHNGATVGVLKIGVPQDNFRNNGRYYVRVASGDSKVLVPIHLVNEKTPSLKVKETPESGKNLHFEVSDMSYAILSPIEKVTLTKPDGKTYELTFIDDYYQMSDDLFILYNDVTANDGKGTNWLDQKGNYTITIDAAGYKQFSKTFYVANGKEVTQAAAVQRIDARSSASTGGSSGGDSTTGGSAINTYMLFNSDLLANALVLEGIGEETDAASTILGYWKSNASSEAVFDKGMTMYYDFTDYSDAQNDAKTKGNIYLPYGEFTKTAKASYYPPHATKELLYDGLWGEIQDSTESGKLETPTYKVSDNEQGKDVVLTFSGDDVEKYLNGVSALYLNGDWRELGSDYYTIDAKAGTITLKQRLLQIGKDNTLKIVSPGYKQQTAKFEYGKVNEKDLSLTAKVDSDKVTLTVDGSDGDFLTNLKSITLTDKNGKDDSVYTKGYEGSDAAYYVLSSDKKSVDLYNVKPGEYTATIAAYYYDDALSTKFSVDGEVKLNKVPEMNVTATQNNGLTEIEFDNVDKVSTGKEIGSWQLAAAKKDKITVNGKLYTKHEMTSDSLAADSTEYAWFTPQSVSTGLRLGNGAIKEGKNEIVIEADGYETYTYTFDTTGGGSTDPDPEPSENQEPAALSSDSFNLQGWVGGYQVSFTNGSDYLKALKASGSVKIDETVLTAADSYQANEGKFAVSGSTVVLPDENLTKGDHTIVFTVDGYKTLTLKATANGSKLTVNDTIVGDTTTEPGGGGETTDPEQQPEQGDKDAAPEMTLDVTDDSGVYHVALEAKGNTTISDVFDWKGKINKVTVGDTEYTAAQIWEAPSASSTTYKVDNSVGYYELILGGKAFADGATTVTISAEGYEDVVVDINGNSGETTNPGGGETDPETQEGLEPISAHHFKEGVSIYPNELYFTNNDRNETISKYVGAITDVIVNGQKYTFTDSSFAMSGNTYAVTNYGSDAYLSMAQTSFNSNAENTIVIKAKGYKPLTVTIAADNTVSNAVTE
ncbi:MAG: DUF1533 domain-containing protein [Peptococcaceae bacterium]|nr:DUF1533 domain-containing protein [Peptococcaceae bacterium]